MERWVVSVGTVVAVILATWGVLIVAARRLPPGFLRDATTTITASATLIRRLWRDPRVPTRARVVLALAGAWLLSPIDLIPEFIPVIGPLDDVVVVALALRYAARSVPREVLVELWPAEPRLLDRLVRPADESHP